MMTLTSSDINALIDDAHRGEDDVSVVPDDHLFMNRRDAMETANEMGLDGVHTMSVDGDTFYVPGKTRERYILATSELSDLGESLSELTVYTV